MLSVIEIWRFVYNENSSLNSKYLVSNWVFSSAVHISLTTSQLILFERAQAADLNSYGLNTAAITMHQRLRKWRALGILGLF